MTWIDKLERRFGHFAMANLALYLVAGQIIVWTANWFKILPVEWFYLNPILVLNGQVWRLVTFLFIPPVTWHPVFLAFAWYIFWMISSALEGKWGTFKFNLFIFLGAAFTVLASLVFPYLYYTNYYIALTVFFAFATLYPNFEFMLFFILPVKVKWLALISLALLVYAFLMGGWPSRFIIGASMANYLLFFGKDLHRSLYYRKRRQAHTRKMREMQDQPFHTCSVCGATDKSNPEREFRYREGKGVCHVCLEKEAQAGS